MYAACGLVLQKREQARQSKAAEEARKKEEKAKLKVVKKVAAQAAKKGFHSAQEMQKSQNLFMVGYLQ